MNDKPRYDPNQNPREIPTKKDPGQVNPPQDPDLTPDENNPINPKTDDPQN